MKIPDATAAVDREWKKLGTVPAWQLEKVKSMKVVILEAQRDKNNVHFATLMDFCHLNVELEPKFQRYKGRVALRGDFVKDDSGAYAVFTEQGSSASQMTAKVTDVIAGHDCDGQAADTESACTLVKLEEFQDCSEFQSQSVRIFGHVFHAINGQNHGPTLKIQWFLLNETFYGHLLVSCGKCTRKFWWNLDGKKCRIGNVFLFDNKDYSYRKTWVTSKWLEWSRNWHPCGRNWGSMLILMNLLHFLITYIWDALNVNISRTISLLMNTEKCSNHEFLLHGRTCSKIELANKKCYTKSQVLAWMNIISRKRNLNQLEKCQKYAHKLS